MAQKNRILPKGPFVYLAQAAIHLLRPKGPFVYLAQAEGLGMLTPDLVFRAKGPTVFPKHTNGRAVGPSLHFVLEFPGLQPGLGKSSGLWPYEHRHTRV